jgi:hypothetical protein
MGKWRKLHNDQLHNMYYSKNIISMIKSRRIKWAVYAACMGEMKNAYKILVGKPEGRKLEGDLTVDRKINIISY